MSKDGSPRNIEAMRLFYAFEVMHVQWRMRNQATSTRELIKPTRYYVYALSSSSSVSPCHLLVRLTVASFHFDLTSIHQYISFLLIEKP
jgi:hypothetical protein